MAEKFLDKIVGQPTTRVHEYHYGTNSQNSYRNKNNSVGKKHESLELVLDEDDYKTVTRYTGATIDRLAKPAPVNE